MNLLLFCILAYISPYLALLALGISFTVGFVEAATAKPRRIEWMA